MGEAKRKTLAAEQAIKTLETLDLKRISNAISRLSIAASDQFATDCYMHAALCHALIEKLGVSTRLTIGFAAWRTGNGDSDVISHAPHNPKDHTWINQLARLTPDMQMQVPCHAWLELGDRILDFTTYQLKQKAAMLDAMDGGKTQVDWAPDYLWVSKSTCSTMNQVTQESMGQYWYQRVEPLERFMINRAESICQDDLTNLMFIYENPSIAVVGPRGAVVDDEQEINRFSMG